MPNFEDNEIPFQEDVTPQDLIDVIRGRATEEQTRRIIAALDDPDSAVSSWLNEFSYQSKEWRRNLGERRSSVGESPTSVAKLESLRSFIRTKHDDGALSRDEYKSMLSAANLDELRSSPPLNAAEATLAVKRLIEAVVTARPEFEGELRSALSTRQR